MKKLLFLLAFSFCFVAANAQGTTAANGTVVVKQGTVSVTGGTISSITTGTFTSKGIDTTNQSLRVVRKQMDSLILSKKGYVATLTFTASSAAGAYTNLTTINSSTSAASNVTSFSVSLPSGKYKLIAANAIVTSTASPTFEVWLFSSSVTTAGDKQNISGNLSNSDMQKFIGDLRFDGTWAGNGAVNKGNGRIGNYSGLTMPIIIDVTNNQFHCILAARASWTPSTSAYHQLYFYLERMAN